MCDKVCGDHVDDVVVVALQGIDLFLSDFVDEGSECIEPQQVPLKILNSRPNEGHPHNLNALGSRLAGKDVLHVQHTPLPNFIIIGEDVSEVFLKFCWICQLSRKIT
jgi:hypothetical protein